ncbi:TOBE domain-containing protein [Sulfurihydrogenibium sp.]|uniref:TOBE domain-containing protein n=2 Tax=Sulfurihydrogenibium sp. TaxID=2053621 RepID=UPI003D0F5AED
MKKKVVAEVYLDVDKKGYLGKGRVLLLELIDKYGSISKAAKELGMSYKAAWDMIDAINNLSPYPVVESKSGGKGGGKTVLTEYGKKLIRDYKLIENLINKISQEITENLEDVENLLKLYKRMNMKISARNQLLGKVVEIKKGMVNTEVIADFSGQRLTAVITNDAAEELNLNVGDEVYFIFKASNVLVYLPDGMKLSTINKIKGKVADIITGAVNSEVKIEASNAVITAIITNEAVKDLGLEKDKEVVALIKASDIIVGKF